MASPSPPLSPSHPQRLTITLKFLLWQAIYATEKPFQIFINIPLSAADTRDTNLVFENVALPVQDVRLLVPPGPQQPASSACSDREPTPPTFPPKHTFAQDARALPIPPQGLHPLFSLDTTGFMYRTHRTKFACFTDRTLVERDYLPEVEALVREVVEEVDRVVIFDWRLRKNAPEVEGTVVDMNDRTEWLRPAVHVHVDHSPAAVLKRVQLHTGEDAVYLLRGRVRVINVWRPLIPSVSDWPLAICDGSTVRPGDLVETDHVRRHYTGSTMYLQRHARQKFYYMNQQRADEVLLFKNFDSRSDVAARYAPHASFQHPHAKGDETPQESIEVRAMVFTYPKN